MTTRIGNGGPATYVSAAPTAARTTAPPARPFQQLISASSNAIVSSAEQVATRLPGGPALVAAVRSNPGAVGAAPARSPEGATTALGGTASGAGSPGALGALGSGGAAAGGAPSMDGVLAQGSDQNMYFLELQERISQESRAYTAISNVLKTRHETVKNAIGNIR
jgi:hypothetical protein